MFDMAKHNMEKSMAEMEEKLMKLKGKRGKNGMKSPIKGKNGGKESQKSPKMIEENWKEELEAPEI